MHDILPPILLRMLTTEPLLAHANIVGGAVRDKLLSLHRPGLGISRPKDFDIEVFGVAPEKLVSLLGAWGCVDEVGAHFSVIKLATAEGTFDFSLPRKETKVGNGHRGFSVEPDPFLSPEMAACRRDFTMNAIAFNVRRSELMDFYGGENDIRTGVLRHTSPAFREDPLRPLRGMQFCGRFDLTASPETIEMCRSMLPEYESLPVERISEEWKKWASRSVAQEKGLDFLAGTGYESFYPMITAERGVPQSPEWHPEGDVYTHVRHCVAFMARNPEWKKHPEGERAVLMFAILAHDFGKPGCTQIRMVDGGAKVTSHGHEAAGVPFAAEFMRLIGQPRELTNKVIALVKHHLAHKDDPTPRGVRRLARRIAPATIELAGLVWHADNAGRPPKPQTLPERAQKWLEMAREEQVQTGAPAPLLLGRDLIACGVEPGRAMGELLARAYEAQLNGDFCDKAGGLAFCGLSLPPQPVAPLTELPRPAPEFPSGEASQRKLEK